MRKVVAKDAGKLYAMKVLKKASLKGIKGIVDDQLLLLSYFPHGVGYWSDNIQN